MRWEFAEQDPGAERRGPQEGQLFKTEGAGETEYAGVDGLVREVIQNSTDAYDRGCGRPLRVRFAIYEAADGPSGDALAAQFARLEPGLRAKEIACGPDGRPAADARFLVVEDFNTRGLCGDPGEHRDPPPGSTGRHDFYWFWRNVGRSAKTDMDLGRWGLGKTVYRSASEIDAMLGLTVRADDGRRLAFGKAVLAIHDHGGREYAPEGYWCDAVRDRVPMPLEEPAALDRFAADWKLARRDEPGLSVVVPYANPLIRGPGLLQAVCVGFFLPILRGQLVVEVACPQVGEVVVDADSIERVAAGLEWKGTKRSKRDRCPPIDFARRSLEADPRTTRDLGRAKAITEITDEDFEPGDLAALRADLAEGRTAAVRLRAYTTADAGVGESLVYLRRAAGPKRPTGYAVREGMTIPRVDSPRASGEGVQALVVVPRLTEAGRANPLASMLGDAEGPSHENWDKSEDLLKKRWPRCGSRVDAARKAADLLLAVLDPPTTEADHDLFAELLPTPDARRRERPRGGGGPPVRKGPEVDAAPRWFRLDGRKGGFGLVGDGKVPRPDGAALRVRLAYDTSRGDPIKRWQEADFDVRGEAITFKAKGARVTARAGNELRVRPSDETFRVSAAGFDAERDLYVRVEADAPPAGAAAGDGGEGADP